MRNYLNINYFSSCNSVREFYAQECRNVFIAFPYLVVFITENIIFSRRCLGAYIHFASYKTLFQCKTILFALLVNNSEQMPYIRDCISRNFQFIII